MDIDERWARGCGSGGIGYSGHVNVGDYDTTTKIGNWIEDTAKREFHETGRHVLGYGGDFRGVTTFAASYVPDGKTGPDLAESYQREDLAKRDICMGKDLMFPHGDFAEPAIECKATLNQLTHGEKRKGEPQVQQYLWSGSKFNDYRVPVATQTTALLTTKQQQWAKQQQEDMYATTSASAALAAASQAAVESPKRSTMRPAAADGQPAQVGRKPKGPCAAEFDKEYQKTGLRQP